MDLTSHVHVPAVNARSYAPSNDLSHDAGQAATVLSKRSFVTGKDDCTGGFTGPSEPAGEMERRRAGEPESWPKGGAQRSGSLKTENAGPEGRRSLEGLPEVAFKASGVPEKATGVQKKSPRGPEKSHSRPPKKKPKESTTTP